MYLHAVDSTNKLDSRFKKKLILQKSLTTEATMLLIHISFPLYQNRRLLNLLIAQNTITCALPTIFLSILSIDK